VIEERIGGSAQVQYVWSAAGQDTLVERDRSPTNNGVMSERLYVQQDANDDLTALVNTSSNVVERYAYEPFGQVFYLSASFGSQSGSNYAEVYLFQGQRTDASTGYDDFRARVYLPSLERFAQPDPTTFGSGEVNVSGVLAGDSSKNSVSLLVLDPQKRGGGQTAGSKVVDSRLPEERFSRLQDQCGRFDVAAFARTRVAGRARVLANAATEKVTRLFRAS
jgi:RHS repeat-associated protein